MTPPEATQAGQRASAGVAPPAVLLCPLETLQNRPDFLRANRGKRQAMRGFLLLARRRGQDEGAKTAARVGFTCSKKLGNAVTRNRAKRRLRAIARTVLPLEGRCGWDYVLIGRPGKTVSCPYDHLLADLSVALDRIHATKAKK